IYNESIKNSNIPSLKDVVSSTLIITDEKNNVDSQNDVLLSSKVKQVKCFVCDLDILSDNSELIKHYEDNHFSLNDQIIILLNK
ncbi:MAG: hypothetical protein MHPSP_002143, partial [Paramarteilia canceri]